ncbi:hypothetical protein KQX54_021442 [Cotesia glomerata]|uniref:Uncharacterized protein n=1 Tax=Cotesia glomerata TaxID=32391 RepID=A0AAV7JA65_COTGL|nr:hypothetical protein KQX54_021442 [Cotesia glomerata]
MIMRETEVLLGPFDEEIPPLARRICEEDDQVPNIIAMVHPTQPLPPNRMNECMRDDAECHCLCRDSYYYTYFEAEAKWLNVLCSIVFSDKSAGTTYTIPLPLPPPPFPLDRGLGPKPSMGDRFAYYDDSNRLPWPFLTERDSRVFPPSPMQITIFPGRSVRI